VINYTPPCKQSEEINHLRNENKKLRAAIDKQQYPSGGNQTTIGGGRQHGKIHLHGSFDPVTN